MHMKVSIYYDMLNFVGAEENYIDSWSEHFNCNFVSAEAFWGLNTDLENYHGMVIDIHTYLSSEVKLLHHNHRC